MFVPEQRFENVPDDPDEVGRMNDVQVLQVLLVSVKNIRLVSQNPFLHQASCFLS